MNFIGEVCDSWYIVSGIVWFSWSYSGRPASADPSEGPGSDKKTMELPTLHLESVALLAAAGRATSMAIVFPGFASMYRETRATNSLMVRFFGLVLIQIKMLMVIKSLLFLKTTTQFSLARSSSRCHKLSKYSGYTLPKVNFATGTLFPSYTLPWVYIAFGLCWYRYRF